RLEVVGDPVPVVENVMVSTFGAANYTISRRGTLVYVPRGTGSLTARRLVWVDRKGREQAINAPPRAYTLPRISPDGTRIALDIRDQDSDVWVLDIAHGTWKRLTFDPGADQQPVWTPDSRRIIFSSGRTGAPNLFAHAADGS